MDIDLDTVAVWGTAARIFVPDLRRAGQGVLAAAVHAGAQHLRRQSASAVSVLEAVDPESEV
ncbi:hypothetical protein N4G70_34535 [Streptomyces sp. ASQP_92]|uniref:hypothetical protein n=1 Tax=Streptomyces sp. ASQP_92 TaxID=2979116 RepID=UPI0021BF15EB|nr:hypothetical protein [Streptomyces sp. ASQP_92]MCT9093938.1 hypothetical protein [Streptomyces sp. ASQP_92]